MERIKIEPRADRLENFEQLGFDWHTLEDGTPYWDESAYWKLTGGEVDELDVATRDLFELIKLGVARVIAEKRLPLYGYDDRAIAAIEQSWANRGTSPTLYARLDLAYGNPAGSGSPKLLEVNGDTPTSLYEAAVVQWHWLLATFPNGDQFNSIHEKLREGLVKLRQFIKSQVHDSDWMAPKLYTTSVAPHPEDEGQLMYLRSVAAEAGLESEFIDVTDIGWRTGDSNAPNRFVDLQDQPIKLLFKLLPWEWLIEDPFGQNLLDEFMDERIALIEPPWKMVCSNKRFLADLWEFFPSHPNLLPAAMNVNALRSSARVVKKPILGREGANVQILEANKLIESAEGSYADDQFVYQEYEPLVEADGKHAVIGSWLIDGKTAGIGFRESSRLITNNVSTFVPHSFG